MANNQISPSKSPDSAAIIKVLMLNYPNSYTSRFSALSHIFMNKYHGFRWTDGEITVDDRSIFSRAQIDLSDLENHEGAADFIALRKQKQIADRIFIGINIDMFAKYDVVPVECNMNIFKNFELNYSLLDYIPYDVISTDWAKAIEYVLEKLTLWIKNEYQDDIPVKFKCMYEKMNDILERLNAITKTIDNMKSWGLK